jgi:hypothetical protein
LIYYEQKILQKKELQINMNQYEDQKIANIFYSKVIQDETNKIRGLIEGIFNMKHQKEKEEREHVGEMTDLQDEFNKMDQKRQLQKYQISNEEERIYNNELFQV